jgi:hypothetical protein
MPAAHIMQIDRSKIVRKLIRYYPVAFDRPSTTWAEFVQPNVAL